MSTKIPWTRVTAEGVVIVASILLAFGIDAAWTGRGERAAEIAYYQLLDRDLTQTIEQLQDYVQYEEERAAAALQAYQALSGGPRPSDEELSIALSVATQRRTVDLIAPAYSDMTSTGNIRLLRDRLLRDEVIRFYEAAERDYDVIARNTALYVDGLLVAALYGPGLIRGSYPGTPTAHDEMGFREPDDRVWALPTEAPDLAALRSALWLRSGGFVLEAARQLEAASELRRLIRTEVEGVEVMEVRE